MRTFLWGIFALAVLDLVLTSKVEIPQAGAGIAKWISDWLDPTVPLITASPVQTSSTPANPTPIPTLGPGVNPLPQPFPLPI